MSSDAAFIIAHYADDPVGYVTDILGAEPDTWQRELLQALVTHQRNAVASGHGVGKTACTAWAIHWFISTRPDPQIVVTANTKNQLDSKTWRELSKWNQRALNRDWFTVTATRMFLNDAPDTWFATAIPWTENNSEAFAGTHEQHVLIVFDEASAIADVIWDVVEGAMTTAGARWLAFGNPTRNTGRFRECWGRFRHRWHTLKVDSRTARMADQAQIQAWIEDYGEDSDFVRIRVRGEFPQRSSAQFIGSDVVDRAQAAKVDAISYQHAPLVMGVDVARFGDDQSVIALRQGRFVHPLIKFRQLDTMQLAGQVARLIDEHQPDLVNIDLGAMGAGVVDRLREQNYDVRGVNFGEGASDPTKHLNRRVEMWSGLRDWLTEGACQIPLDAELASDLIGPEYSYNSKQVIVLEKKADMKRRGLASPDCADALALTFAFPINAQRPARKPRPKNRNWRTA